MNFKPPKNRPDTHWTLHSIEKMKQYALSEQRIRRVLKSPKRVEEGVAPNTIAVMQPASYTAKNPTEIWVMYQRCGIMRNEERKRTQKRKGGLNAEKIKGLEGSRSGIKIISVWRYPGISPKGKVPEIPEEVWDILENN